MLTGRGLPGLRAACDIPQIVQGATGGAAVLGGVNDRPMGRYPIGDHLQGRTCVLVCAAGLLGNLVLLIHSARS